MGARAVLDLLPCRCNLPRRLAQDFQVPAAGHLFDRISQTPAAHALLRRLERGGALSGGGVAAPAQPFLAAWLQRVFPKRPIVVVTDHLKTQEAFHQDLTTWLQMESGKSQPPRPGEPELHPPPSTGNPLFYPGWEILPHEGKLPHADVISERLETLVALSNDSAIENRNSELIVTTVTALLQRTFSPAALRQRTRPLQRGERHDPLDLVEWLEDQGYEPEAQVTQKGEISLRGGILDVFPPTSPWPVRLEFFGDELESLRHFDPLTQMSREETTGVTLPPAGELGILKREAKPVVQNVHGPSAATASVSSEHDRTSRTKPEIAVGETTVKRLETLTPLATLLDYLPRETIFIFCEPLLLAERANDYAAQIPPDDPFFMAWDDLVAELDRRGMTRLAVSEQPLACTPDLSLGAKDRPLDGELPRPTVAAHQDHEPTLPLPACGHPLLHSEWRRGTGRGGASVHEKGDTSPPSDYTATPTFSSLDAFRPLSARLPDPPIAEAQRRDFFHQLHRWLRQDYAVQVFCNNAGERQRFTEIWAELGLSPESVPSCRDEPANPGLGLHLGTLARGFLCEEARLVVVTDAEIFGRYKVQRPRRLKSPHALATRSALDIDFTDLEAGDLVVHVQYGIGRFLGLKHLPATSAVTHSTHGRPPETECLVIEYAPANSGDEPPKLYVPVTESHLVGKYVGAGKANPPLNTLGGTRWARAREQAERAVRDVAAELLRIQAVRESQAGHAFAADAPWQREFESAFIFEETPDQMRAIVETKTDMERAKPMDRLICGDVGFGKTEVAIRAAFKAVMGGKQVAVLVPTTVLAQQHFNNFRERMADYPVRVELLSRFRSRREQHRVVRDLAAGAVDIVIGTHRLVQEDIAFKDLGLVVIDEEQRFGVLHKEKFKRLRTLVDVLTLSATPIPRTLYLALTGARDMSTIQTPPHDRLPVETIVTEYDERVIRDAIQRELNRGGQVFFLHNRVLTIETIRAKLQTLVPHARIVVGHGQMHADDLEEIMTLFVNGEADVLLSTTIIESGLDIPNANTIIIDRADRFGLSDLYQLRGRVGRYKHQAYAYLLLPRHARLLTDVRKRISAMKQYATLGSGFKIAMRDLEIRGAGNLLGAEQSGHITAVGFELYCQLLKQSVAGLKGEPVKPRVEVRLALDFLGEAAQLPERYVPEPHHRIEIYRKLAQATDKAALEALQRELRDRFGPLPAAVELLLAVAELKIIAGEKGVTSIEVKETKVMLTRNNDYLTLGGKFPRLTRQNADARLKEIKRLLLAL